MKSTFNHIFHGARIYLEDKLVLESPLDVEVRSLNEYEKILGEGI